MKALRKLPAGVFAAAATAATAVAAQSPPPPRPGVSIVTMPDWLKKPSNDAMASAWPAAAKGKSGRATVSCEVNVQGLLEKCEVLSEDPSGVGFGQSALLLTRHFQMRPRLLDGKPVSGGRVRIPINFKTGKSHGYNETINVIPNPAWREAPSTAEVAAAYPKGTTDVGHLVFRCGLNEGYTVRECELLSGERAFESAARGLFKKFRLQLPEVGRRDREKLRVILPVHMGGAMASAAGTQRIVAPQWSRVLDPARIQRLFPEKAVAAGLKSGRGVAECTVGVGGELETCAPKSEAPAGMGFAASAVLVVDALAIFPWTTDGRPVDGARITVPVQFNLAQTDIPAATAPAPPR